MCWKVDDHHLIYFVEKNPKQKFFFLSICHWNKLNQNGQWTKKNARLSGLTLWGIFVRLSWWWWDLVMFFFLGKNISSYREYHDMKSGPIWKVWIFLFFLNFSVFFVTLNHYYHYGHEPQRYCCCCCCCCFSSQNIL